MIGKAHESWQTEAITSYLDKLKPFAKAEIREFPEGHRGSNATDPAQTRKREAASLLDNLPKHTCLIALDETGKTYASETFARTLSSWADSGQTVVFCIGGSWGLDESVRNQAQAIISFGPQTLPHILARIVLVEQLYRAETILHNKTYHK